jgi:hypothetical protein
MAIIWPCPLALEAYAAAGRDVKVPRAACRECRQPLIFWSGYPRFVRSGAVAVRIWVRRGRCAPCSRTHALLPSFLLLRRLDEVSIIGIALARGVNGMGQRTIATALGIAHTTVRDWRRRHKARAPALAAGFAAAAVALSGMSTTLSGDHERAALEALAAAWIRAEQRFGAGVGDAWRFAATVTGGGWLATNTTPPWADVDGSGFIPPQPHMEG